MNNFVVDQAGATGAEVNEDLLTFQQARRPSQQAQPSANVDPLEAQKQLLNM